MTASEGEVRLGGCAGVDDGSDDGGGGGTPHGSPSRHAAGDLARGGGKGKKVNSTSNLSPPSSIYVLGVTTW